MARPDDNIERFDSGSGSLTASSDGLIAREVEVKWLFQWMRGYAAAEAHALDGCPLYYSGHKRTRLDVNNLGNGWYEATAAYGNAGLQQYEGTGIDIGGGVIFAPGVLSFDTTGGSEHITQAWSDSNSPSAYVQGNAAEGQAPETYGAINANADSVQGVDITVPSFQFTESWHIPAAYLLTGATPHIKRIYGMTGKVNSQPFRIFQAGEVLFLGARCDTSRSQTMVTVTFSFSARLNRDTFDIGDIEGISKKGWDYLWVEYETVAESDVGVRKPRYAYTARVYEYKNFSELGIGTDWPAVWLSPPGVSTFTHPLEPAQKGVM